MAPPRGPMSPRSTARPAEYCLYANWVQTKRSWTPTSGVQDLLVRQTSVTVREWRHDMRDLPGRLGHAGAVVATGGTGAAAVVPAQRPEGQLGDVPVPGPRGDVLGAREREDLQRPRLATRAVVVDAEHLGDADHAPEAVGRAVRVQRVQRADQAGRGGLRVPGHLVRLVVVVVERHDVDDVDAHAVPDRVREHVDAGLLQPGGAGGQRVDDVQRAAVPRGPFLDLVDGLVTPVDTAGVGQRVVLDVHVQPGHVVGRDDLDVGGRDLVDVGAAVGDLGRRVVGADPAEGRHDVAAARPDLGDVRAEHRAGDRLGRVTVPEDVAGPGLLGP